MYNKGYLATVFYLHGHSYRCISYVTGFTKPNQIVTRIEIQIKA